MRVLFRYVTLIGLLSLIMSPVFAKKNNESACCNHMGGVSYCDSSAGRLVCNNGFYSVCYCTPHAVMDLQLLQGCCMWHGGVLPPDVNISSPSGLIVCNDGYISEECSLQNPADKIAAW